MSTAAIPPPPDPVPPPPRPRRSLREHLFHSATLRTSALYAITGVAFMAGNLVLARVMSVPDFAEVALVIALVGFGGLLGPLGQERVVVRRDLPAGWGLLARGAAASTLVALGIAGVAGLAYGIDAQIVPLLLLGSAAYGLAILASAKFQSERRFVLSTLVSQSPGPLLMAAAFASIATGVTGRELLVTAFFAAGVVAVAIACWAHLLAAAPPGAPPYRIDWPETLALTGISAVAALTATLERLLTPLLLTPRDLAELAVLASLVVAPMRMLQLAAQRTLTPRLRDAATSAVRRRILGREGLLASAVVAVSSIAAWILTGPATDLLLRGKYTLEPPLVAAALAGGAARVVNAFALAAVTALAPRERLQLVNASGWLTTALAVPAAWLGARAGGLAGLLLGVGLASLVQTALLFQLVLPALRDPA